MPSSLPIDSARCDFRLPAAALAYRRKESLLSFHHLRTINVTAWLYRDRHGVEGIQVNPNTPIAEIIKKFGRAETPDAEVGFHSEFHAGEWFRLHPHRQVLQIFSERIPCRQRCGPFLRLYYPDVPWFYYYDPGSFIGAERAPEILRRAYDLPK